MIRADVGSPAGPGLPRKPRPLVRAGGYSLPNRTPGSGAVANSPNGRIVVGGNVEDGKQIDMFAARYLAD